MKKGSELKLVFPQEMHPRAFDDLAHAHFFLPSLDRPHREANIAEAATWCRTNPSWRLSLQTHELLRIP